MLPGSFSGDGTVEHIAAEARTGRSKAGDNGGKAELSRLGLDGTMGRVGGSTRRYAGTLLLTQFACEFEFLLVESSV